MKKLATLFTFLFVFCSASVYGVEYPKPYGHVNDFANILPQDVAKMLETELRTYKEKTSIEISVVTVKSLEGLSVEDYTIELARHWGVGEKKKDNGGEKKKDNGVVFLIAPNERKARIEVGYGLEPDLTDAQSGRIMRDQIVPLFKKGKMADGVIAGVAGILMELGTKSYAAREEERRAEAERKLVEAERSREVFLNFLLVTAPFLILGVFVWYIVHVFRRHLKWQQKLRLTYDENTEMYWECHSKISEAAIEHPLALKNLEELKKESVEDIWKVHEKALLETPAVLSDLKDDLLNFKKMHDSAGWKQADKSAIVIRSLLAKAENRASLLEAIQSEITEVRKAKREGPKLLKELPESIKKAESAISDSDVSSSTKQKVGEAKVKYAEAKTLAGELSVNWLVAFALLSAASTLLKDAIGNAESEKDDAERARRRSREHYNTSPTIIIGGGGGGGDGGGNFGGFGGGDFGGGGASGSW